MLLCLSIGRSNARIGSVDDLGVLPDWAMLVLCSRPMSCAHSSSQILRWLSSMSAEFLHQHSQAAGGSTTGDTVLAVHHSVQDTCHE